MSYLAEVAANLESEVYDYHLPHTKTIDLIGEEFAPRKHNVIVESLGSTTVTSNISTTSSSSGLTQTFGPNVVFVNANGTSSMPIQVQQLLQQAQQQASGGSSSNNIVSVALAPQHSVPTSQVVTSSNGIPHTFTFAPLPPSLVSSSTLVSLIQQPHITTQGNHDGLTFTNSGLSSTSSSGGHTLLTTSLPFNPVTVDLPHNLTNSLGSEESGVLLCNLDELSKYIPENFYSDLCVEQSPVQLPISHQVVSMPDYLQTVMAGCGKSSSAVTTTVSANQVTTTSSQQQFQSTPILSSGISGSQGTQLSNITQIQGPPGNLIPHPITIQLPTQPQPMQAVKTVTYVSSPRSQGTSLTSNQQPVRLAYTTSGERIAIQGFDPSKGNLSNFQFQVKPQTLQFAVDPSKLTVLQELPEVGKVVIQESRGHCDSIANILEEMKSDPDGTEVATAIPVAVSSLAGDPKKTTIKRVAAPASTVILPNKRSRNIIFAGNTLPQGAIPIQINGMNALPISAVKSLPATINLSSLTPTSLPMMTASGQVVAARKTRVEVVTPQRFQTAPGPPTALQAASLISKLNNNNINNNSGPTIHFQKVFQQQQPQPQQQQPPLQLPTITLPPISTHTSTSTTTTTTVNPRPSGVGAGNNSTITHKAVGNNKTCNWVFENGEICGKTFSKSYNLVVHMRMHEDVRPFSCSLCDQTFRQKAHLQRHETTHGLGSKVSKSPGGGGASSGGFSNPKRKRKRSRGTANPSVVVVTSGGATTTSLSGNIILPNTPVSASALSENLQRRLAHVTEKFGGGSNPASGELNEDEEEMEEEEGGDDSDSREEMCVMADNAVKNYSKRRYLDINGKDEGEADDGDKEGEMLEYQTEMLEDSQGNKIESSYVEVQDEVGDLRDEDIIEQVHSDHHFSQDSQPISLSHENGTIQIIVTNGGSGIPTTLADMVSRMNHSGGGQTILLQDQVEVKEDDGNMVDDQQQHHVVVTTSNDLGHGGETIVIRNLEEHSPEMQKEILNALLQHHAETQAAQQQHNGVDGHSTGPTTLRYVIENRRDDEDDEDQMCNDNVKVEAEPTSGGEMSPESLTAISGGHISGGHQHSEESLKNEEELDLNRTTTVDEFMRK